jgi:transcriptional regulator with XRE-family HTH domain
VGSRRCIVSLQNEDCKSSTNKIGITNPDQQGGERSGINGDIVGKYERNEMKPSIETAKKLADALEVSLDYLVGEGELRVLDKRTLKRLEDIENLPDEDRSNIYYTLDNLIKAAKLKAI